MSSAADKDLVIFDCGGHVKIVNGKRFTKRNSNRSRMRIPRKRRDSAENPIAFNGEMMFTAMLLGVENPQPLKAYFLQGDGEPSLSDSGESGYQKFGAVLAENYIAAVPLNLLGGNAVPEDCDLLIIAGPTSAFHGGGTPED